MRPAPSPYPTKAEWTIHAHATRVPFSFVDGHAILIPTNNARKPKKRTDVCRDVSTFAQILTTKQVHKQTTFTELYPFRNMKSAHT